MSRRVFGVGVDIAHVPRVQKTIQRYGSRFLRRAFSREEIAHFQKLSESGQERARFAASRWALKEAATKAFGQRLLFPEIALAGGSSKGRCCCWCSFTFPADQRRSLAVSGKAQSLFAAQNICAMHASLSHDGDYAAAFVVLECEAKPNSSAGAVR